MLVIPDHFLVCKVGGNARLSFSLEVGGVLGVFVGGSHLYGSCNRRSDWDVVIIAENTKTLAAPVNAHKGNIDAWIVPRDDFITFVRDHLVQALLTLWIPADLVLFKKPGFDSTGGFRYSAEPMKCSVEKLFERDVRIASKHFAKGDSADGLKIVKHFLRQLRLCEQIIEHGYIFDYASFDEETFSQISSTSWKEIHDTLDAEKVTVLKKISVFHN